MKATAGISLYWKCQLIGWSVASLYWVLVGMVGTGFSLPFAVILFAGDLIIYIVPTHAFRLISLKNKWEQLRPKQLIGVVIPAILILGLVFMVLTIGKNFLAKYLLAVAFEEGFSSFFQAAWLTTWMTGIRLAAIWVLAYYLYHYGQAQLRATKEAARLSMLAKNAQLENLREQLNPHFFFNALNTIKALVSENPANARRAIDLLSDLLRGSLYGKFTSLITIEEELYLLKDYLELEQLRFEDRLQISLNVPKNVLPALILPLSIHTLAENAIKHGIAHSESGGEIAINIQLNGSFIWITVKNPGQLQITQDAGLGLKNLRERLQLQYNEQAIFSIAIEDGNVLAKLVLPYAARN